MCLISILGLKFQVQALRSIGRCMRFCGNSESNKQVLEILAEMIFPSGHEAIPREVDIDRLRCEAAAAILNICEVSVKMSMPLVLSLAHMMIV